MQQNWQEISAKFLKNHSTNRSKTGKKQYSIDKIEHTFYNFCIATKSCWNSGGICVDENNKEEYYRCGIVEAIEAMKSEKYLEMVLYFARACFREEKEKEA